MPLLQNILFPVFINAVPLAGFAFGGWNSATALVVYWFENVIGILLIAVRIALHRRFTQKEGHYRAQINVKTTTRHGTTVRSTDTTFLAEFLLTSVVFTAAHGFFLGILLMVMRAPIQFNDVAGGVLAIAAFQLINFVIDVTQIKTQPFAWIKRLAQLSIGRVGLVHIALIAGVFLAGLLSNNSLFVVPFAVLKLLSEVSTGISLAQGNLMAPPPPSAPLAPAWFISAMNKIKPSKTPGDDFGAYLINERERELAEAALDEQVRVTKRGTGRG